MISFFLLITSIGWECPSFPSPEETARMEKLFQMVEQDANQYLSCSIADDCYYLPFAGGHIVSKSGLSAVAQCSDTLSRRLFPICYSGSEAPGIDPPLRKVPLSIRCEANRCKGYYDDNTNERHKSKLLRPWLSKYSKYLKKSHSKPLLDSTCEGYVREIESMWKQK
jgi:hypothetical protein